MTKQVYLGATLGNRGARLLNEEYQKAITGAGGMAYLAQNNKDINDKKNAKQEGLAKRIVEADFGAIDNSDAYLFDLLETTGTTCEIAGIYAQKRLAKQMDDFIVGITELGGSAEDVLREIEKRIHTIMQKPVVVTCSDLRSENMKDQAGFSREWGMNQMLRGIVDEVTDGEGFTPFEIVTPVLAEKLK